MRSGGEAIYDHPGTKQHKRGGTCGTCNTNNFQLIPADLQDQRHQLLSDEEMEHIMHNHPTAFTWHAERRKRLRLGEYS